MKRCLLILVMMYSHLLFGSANNGDFLTKYHDLLILDKDNFKTSEIDNWLTKFDGQERFIDIDYTAVNSNDFQPVLSLYRASIMSRAFYSPEHPYYQKAKLKEIALKATRLWLKLDLRSYNWWNNIIGVQSHLVGVVLEFWDEFTPSEKNKISEIFLRSSVNHPDTGGRFTGQNLLWACDFYMLRGHLFNRPSDIEIGANTIKSSFFFFSHLGDGFQPDGSFFQHGSLIYSTGYGASFTETMSKYFYLFHGTPYEFNSFGYAFWDNYVLDGQSKLTYGYWMDFQASGRTFARNYFAPYAIKKGVEYMLKAGSPRHQEYVEYFKALSEDRPRPMSFNHHYFNGDMMVHQMPNFYSSIRMHSTRTLNTDYPSNNEGILSHNISDGTLIFFTEQNEYRQIFAAWDYNKIPGTTADQVPLIPSRHIPEVESGLNMVTRGKSSFIGGVSDGLVGLATMDFKKALVKYNLSFKKSWFFLPEGVIALGSDISCPDCPGEVVTTVDQTKGDLTEIFESSNVLEYNHKVAVNLGKTPWTTVSKNVMSNWHRVNSSMPDENRNQKMFFLTISHGLKPKNGSYIYGFASNVELADKFKSWALVNTGLAQYAWNEQDNLYLGSMFSSQEIKMGKIQLKTSRPMAFVLEKVAEGWALSVSDPSQKEQMITVVVSTDSKSKSLDIMLPTGKEAGKSVKKFITF